PAAGGGLAGVHARVAGAAGEAGFPQEDRSFHPHLTLARFGHDRPPEGWSAVLRDDRPDLGPFDIRSVVLFESLLRPAGAEHRPLEEYPLP
ncbi:MAG TPA: 2'-5' RNA ligase family protein, partial [Candidatus Polarisedimenticolia bacterium]|nr:2'-5' RNA ligase family protein [Candidatus Polarisedimenticolia bacterium]